MELGEARFVTGFLGATEDVRTVQALGFTTHDGYAAAFADRLAAYLKAGYILKDEAQLMQRRASLCPPLTFTQTYHERYEEFTAAVPCGG